MIEMISDVLLAAGALGAAFYCIVLSRRLRRFNDLENGVGGAVAVLSAQVDELTKMMGVAQTQVVQSSGALSGITDRAEDAARRLELMVASLHDLPSEPPSQAASPPVAEEPLEQAIAEAQEEKLGVEPASNTDTLPPQEKSFAGISAGGIPDEEDCETPVFRPRSRQGAA